MSCEISKRGNHKERKHMIHLDDTIAAISTAQGAGGIGIVRVSGREAFSIAERIFKGRKAFSTMKSYTLAFGTIADPDTGEMLDEVLISKMAGPKSFTCEDVVEINCHGGTVVQGRVLELVLRNGGRLAEPGEFTKRAFLNGRIDLAQAEAVIDIINAKTEESNRTALDQLEGRLSKKVGQVRRSLIGMLAHIEVTVDYPEHDIEEITGKMAYEELLIIRGKLAALIASFHRGRIMREGISAVIAGRPNVGKSSLLNELSGKRRAIVTDIPGTTRDTIEEYINIRGIPVRLVDTAGIRETEDVVERIGVEMTRKALQKADLLLIMVDAAHGLTPEDVDILKEATGRKVLVLVNKIDLVEEAGVTDLETRLSGMFSDGWRILPISVKEDVGLDRLEDEIEALFFKGEIQTGGEPLVTNIRHKSLLDGALRSIDDAMGAYEGGMPLDLITIDIRNAAEALGKITGESVDEDVMHEIFSRFCIGK